MIPVYNVILENRIPKLLQLKQIPDLESLKDPKSVVKWLNDNFYLNKLAEEYVYVLAVDANVQPIAIFELSHGIVNASLVRPREVFIRLLLTGATGFFIIHNHPSGSIKPSRDDYKIVQVLEDAAKLLSFDLLDSIVIGGDSYFSMKENKGD